MAALDLAEFYRYGVLKQPKRLLAPGDFVLFKNHVMSVVNDDITMLRNNADYMGFRILLCHYDNEMIVCDTGQHEYDAECIMDHAGAVKRRRGDDDIGPY